MLAAALISGSLIVFTLGMQILHSFWFKEGNERSKALLPKLKFVFTGAVLLTLALRIIDANRLYWTWRFDTVSRYFLPPFRSWGYFLEYVGSRMFAPWAIALLAAMLAFNAAKYLNRRYEERFFEKEEPWIFAAATLFVGYPGFLFYWMGLGIAAIVWTIIVRMRGYARAPLYYLWLPVALIVIIIVYRFVPAVMFAQFNL